MPFPAPLAVVPAEEAVAKGLADGELASFNAVVPAKEAVAKGS